ncbi:GGDEF domain-containing protein [Lysobacter brunescens]|uniref:diguanylate cyclase n=1 Tax=Lysobacter brunescens TaxID=262323 RepID=A0ABW2YHL4_9GAMM
MDFVRAMFVSALLFATSLSAMAQGGGGASFDALLNSAEKYRSSDSSRFTALLAEMESRKKEASAAQLQRYDYLRAYEAVVYKDEIKAGIETARRLFEGDAEPTLKFRAGSLVANAAALNRDFTTGLRYLERSLEIRNSVRSKVVRHEGLGAAAVIYNQMGQHEIALRYAKEILKDSPSARIRCGVSHARLSSEFALSRVSDSNEGISRIIQQCAEAKEPIGANLVRIILAKKLAKEQKLQDALALMDGALQEVESTKYPWLIADFRAVLSELKFDAGDFAAAEAHANEAVSYGKQVASSAALVTAYRTLYRIQANKEKGTVALELYKRYAESQMAHQSDVKARELAYEIVRHETQQKNKEIELLQAQQRLERENTQKAQLTTLFLAILLAGIVFWAFQIKRHQQQLKKLAQTDSLTGLGNRHYFTQKSERALVDAARAGEPASLVMFDLDHFKAINDTYGHGAGDWVLKQVGKTCSAHCRKVDYIGRIGGEEFAVLLRGIDLAGASRLAEDCRAQLAQIDTRDCGYSFVVTGSFGVSSTAQSGYDLSRLLSHADQMLYRAKNEGRNRVCAYTTEAAADHRSARRSPSLSVVNR